MSRKRAAALQDAGLHEQAEAYRADAKTCNACAQKKECTDSGRGRTVWRHFDEDYFDRLRAYQIRGDYQKALRKRKVWVEPLFAEAKRWHGMDRFRLRTLAKVNQEALMVACVQNLKRLLGAASAGPLRPPTACAQAAGCAVRPPALVPRTAPEILCHPVFLRRFSTRWIVFETVLAGVLSGGFGFSFVKRTLISHLPTHNIC